MPVNQIPNTGTFFPPAELVQSAPVMGAPAKRFPNDMERLLNPAAGKRRRVSTEPDEEPTAQPPQMELRIVDPRGRSTSPTAQALRAKLADRTADAAGASAAAAAVQAHETSAARSSSDAFGAWTAKLSPQEKQEFDLPLKHIVNMLEKAGLRKDQTRKACTKEVADALVDTYCFLRNHNQDRLIPTMDVHLGFRALCGNLAPSFSSLGRLLANAGISTGRTGEVYQTVQTPAETSASGASVRAGNDAQGAASYGVADRVQHGRAMLPHQPADGGGASATPAHAPATSAQAQEGLGASSSSSVLEPFTKKLSDEEKQKLDGLLNGIATGLGPAFPSLGRVEAFKRHTDAFIDIYRLLRAGLPDRRVSLAEFCRVLRSRCGALAPSEPTLGKILGEEGIDTFQVGPVARNGQAPASASRAAGEPGNDAQGAAAEDVRERTPYAQYPGFRALVARMSGEPPNVTAAPAPVQQVPVARSPSSVFGQLTAVLPNSEKQKLDQLLNDIAAKLSKANTPSERTAAVTEVANALVDTYCLLRSPSQTSSVTLLDFYMGLLRLCGTHVPSENSLRKILGGAGISTDGTGPVVLRNQ